VSLFEFCSVISVRQAKRIVDVFAVCFRSMGDKLGEAKSSGNLGNTLKVMGKFDEAMICCKRHLEISRELGDKVS